MANIFVPFYFLELHLSKFRALASWCSPYLYSLNRMLMMRSALLWVVSQRVVVNHYRCFGTTYGVPSSAFWISWPLKMILTGCLETSVRIYHYTLRNNPEERRSYIHCGGSLKSRRIFTSF